MLLLGAGRTLVDVQFTLNQSRYGFRDGRGSGGRWRSAQPLGQEGTRPTGPTAGTSPIRLDR
jgi:hypothetical protein